MYIYGYDGIYGESKNACKYNLRLPSEWDVIVPRLPIFKLLGHCF